MSLKAIYITETACYGLPSAIFEKPIVMTKMTTCTPQKYMKIIGTLNTNSNISSQKNKVFG